MTKKKLNSKLDESVRLQMEEILGSDAIDEALKNLPNRDRDIVVAQVEKIVKEFSIPFGNALQTIANDPETLSQLMSKLR